MSTAVAAFAALSLVACHPAPAHLPPGGTGSAAPEKDLRTVLQTRLHASPPDEPPAQGVLPEGGVSADPPPHPITIRTEELENDVDEDVGGEERKKEDDRAGDDGVDDQQRARPRAATASALGGKLSADQVNAVIDANFDRLSSCSNSEAIVSIRATVSTEGRVLEASAVRSTPDDPRIRDCIASTFKTLEFPRIASEWPTRLSFDLRVGGS